MQKAAITYRSWIPCGSAAPPPGHAGRGFDETKSARKAVAENAVVIFARKECCMCHVAKLLLHGHGVNPTILHVDERNEDDVTTELSEIKGGDAATTPQFPAVFVGGELFGGLEEVMGAHISGQLVPRLREAKALWL